MNFSTTRVSPILFLFGSAFAGSLILSALPQHAAPPAPASGIVLELDPAQCAVHWTLGTTLHTVHGTFALKNGSIQLDPATGKATGEILVSATSAESGNDSRDKKMHKDVLESGRYPDIVFRPDRFEGTLAQDGLSTLQLHGTFSIHGLEHEMTVITQGELSGDHWTGHAKFSIPFIEWGLKNPSNFLFKVNHSVELEVDLKGKLQISILPHA